MIYAMMPFATIGIGYNLGRAYNDAMARLGPRDWACFIDHDMMFTTTAWYGQLERAIRTDPRGAFTAVTNRMGHPWQIAEESRSTRPSHRVPQRARQAVLRPQGMRVQQIEVAGNDIAKHRQIGSDRLRVTTLLDVTETRGWGGVVMLLSKEAWLDAGGFVDGLLCVDHAMHYALAAAGRRIYVIEGLYVYHWRGTTGNGSPPAHIPVAAKCPCSGIPYGSPSRRVEMVP